MSKFWDNIIQIKPSLAGIQLAGWLPRPPATSGKGCRLLADQRVKVDEGVSLSADVYLPKTPGRYPAVVVFSAYNKELHTAGLPTGSNEIGSPPVFADRGYAPVIVNRRGMGRSDGTAGVFFNPQDVDDHERCIAWAAEQTWCDGNVVLFGTSYYGMVQPLVAARKPPALKAFFCNEICTDYFRQIFQFGGVPALYFLGVWTGANFNETQARLRVPPMVRAIVSHIANSRLKPILGRMVMKRVDKMFRIFSKMTPVRAVREWYVNWILDGKTRETSCTPAGPSGELDKIQVPFVVVQNLGYFNLHQFGSYDLFENAGTPDGGKWMILGPPEYELPVYSWQLEAIAFFDYIVRGVDNGYREQAPVRYWLDGTEKFVGASSFPIPGSISVRLYPASCGEDRVRHTLSTEPPAGGENRWAAIPMNSPVVSGLDEVVNQKLTYELVAEEHEEFSGPVTAHLRFSCNEIDSHLVARLGRVDRDGSYHLLSLGTISPARRRVDAARSTACEVAIDTSVREPLTPGEPVTLVFSLTPGPTQLSPGEKLVFDVASRVDLLRSGPSHGYVQFDMPAPPYFSRNTLHYGPETYVEVHRIGS